MSKEQDYREKRGASVHTMPVAARAKQFAPFDALTGLGAAILAKEREHEVAQHLKNKPSPGFYEEFPDEFI